MQFQDQLLPQAPNTIHNLACAPFQAITLGHALLLFSFSMGPFLHMIPSKPVHRAPCDTSSSDPAMLVI